MTSRPDLYLSIVKSVRFAPSSTLNLTNMSLKLWAKGLTLCKIESDTKRNKLSHTLELFLSSGTVCLSMYSLVAAIFGMNIPYPWRENHGYLFKWVVMLTVLACGSLFLSIITYARHKGLVGSN
ncbi:Magnesium transporter MRS2-I [Sesamum angolense]|uniref:Magnesium transporter MRS2-I n=1 Tax=Sesamum angolense TaxID=2727404 RepID=A0AAE1XAW9_9LAMI|nr:Magnesium transporter MRS2-I [Sesamum angolense]